MSIFVAVQPFDCTHGHEPVDRLFRYSSQTSDLVRFAPLRWCYCILILSIQHSMLDVRCSMFIWSAPPTRTQS